MRRATRWSLIGAVLWSAGIVLAGFVVPVYQTASTNSDGTTETSTATLVGEEGTGVLIVLAFPLLASLIVAAAVWAGSPPVRAAAWTVAGALALLSVLGAMTIGLFIAPVVAALMVALATSRRSAP